MMHLPIGVEFRPAESPPSITLITIFFCPSLAVRYRFPLVTGKTELRGMITEFKGRPVVGSLERIPRSWELTLRTRIAGFAAGGAALSPITDGCRATRRPAYSAAP